MTGGGSFVHRETPHTNGDVYQFALLLQTTDSSKLYYSFQKVGASELLQLPATPPSRAGKCNQEEYILQNFLLRLAQPDKWMDDQCNLFPVIHLRNL